MDWIKVEDRLPEEDGLFIVYGNCTGSGVGFDMATFDKEDNHFNKFNQPTHWMPLPEEPK